MVCHYKRHGQMSESFLTAAFIILSGGLQDAYTYLCRGKVFANAQTGNIVLFSAYLFDGEWEHWMMLLPKRRSWRTVKTDDALSCTDSCLGYVVF